MRVGIVGAGIAGLAAARTLTASGIETVVFERSRGYGGRCATRRVSGYVFDSGATIVSPYTHELGRVMTDELDTSELVEVERPIFLHSFGRVTGIDPQKNVRRYAYQHGINTLGKLLAEPLDVRLETEVDQIEQPADGGYAIAGETFDRLILTPPIPETEQLLRSVGDTRSFSGSRYRSCLSVLLGFEGVVDKPYHALIDPHQSEPLTWLSIETLKVPDTRAPEGCTAVVAQMSARYSRYSFTKPDEEIVRETVLDVGRILGNDYMQPVVSQVVRWKYSHVSNTLSFGAVNKADATILVASDGLIGARVHQAYDIGIEAAQRLLNQ